MKILNVDQIHALDQSTIEHEPIAPINLMERAALAFVDWFVSRFPDTQTTKIFCGLGNNGGDGLAIARLLLERHYPVDVHVVRYAPRESDDFMHNHRRLKLITENIRYIEFTRDLPALRHNEVVIDAILGSGLSRTSGGDCQKRYRYYQPRSPQRSSLSILPVAYMPTGPTRLQMLLWNQTIPYHFSCQNWPLSCQKTAATSASGTW